MALLVVGLAMLLLGPSDGVGAATLTVPTDHPTIQDAVDHAEAYDTILILASTSDEAILLPEDKEGLTVVGDGSGRTWVTGNYPHLLTIKADFVTVEGITFSGTHGTVGILLLKVHSCTLRDVVSRGCLNGLNVSRSRECVITDCRFISNKDYGIYMAGDEANYNEVTNTLIRANGVGVVLNATSGGCKGNTFVKDTFIDNVQFGVWVTNKAGPNTFHHCNFIDNGKHYEKPHPGDTFDDGEFGNYWDDYKRRYPYAVVDGQVWDTPYQVELQWAAFDYYPLAFKWDPRTPSIELEAFEQVTVGHRMEVIADLSVVENEVVSFSWTIDKPDSTETRSTALSWLIYTPRVLGEFIFTLELDDVYGYHAEASITVRVVDDVPPVVIVGEDIDANIGEVVVLDGTGSRDNHVVALIFWVVDPDGLGLMFSTAVAKVRFDVEGDYLAVLTLVDTAGNTAFATLTIHVRDREPPLAYAGGDAIVNMGETVTLDGSRSRDNVGIVKYRWTFTYLGVLRSLSGKMVSFTFESPGTYEVTLTVSDDIGHSTQDNKKVTVLDSIAPVAVAGEDVIIGQENRVRFDGTGSSDNLEVHSYEWTFVYRRQSRYIRDATHYFMFEIPGVYLVNLLVMDGAGNWGSDTMVVTVLDTEFPTAKGKVVGTYGTGEPVTFDGSRSTDNVGIVRYRWSFIANGRSVNLTGMYGSFAFGEAGDHTIKLTVFDAAGNTATNTFVVTIEYVGSTGGEEGGSGWVFGLVAASVVGIVVVAFVSRRLYDRHHG